jgi:hypothetical protein
VVNKLLKFAVRHHARLSMTLRQLKFVDIKLTGTPETRSTSSMKRTVSRVSWSKRYASRFALFR